MSNWYIVQTKSLKEFVAIENLINQNFKVYLPVFDKTINYKDGFKNIKTPLFPGYIFVSTNSLNKTWHKINYTRGVKSIVSFGNNISPIDKNFVDDLKKTEVNGRICFFKIKKLRIGDSCKITGGIFKNYFCFINKMCPKDRVKVLLKFLGREINCMVSRNILEPSFSA